MTQEFEEVKRRRQERRLDVRAFLFAAAVLITPVSFAAVEIDVRYANGSTPLAALLIKPDGEGAFAAVVVAHGSGPADRKNTWARQIADFFVDRRIAVLLTDKRGSGASGGDWRAVGFEELAADALAGVEFLKKRSDIDSKRIGLLGLSQGGWVVPIAASRSSDVAFVIDLVGATVSYAEQSFTEMTNTARQSGLSDAAVEDVRMLNRAAGRYLLFDDWNGYVTARQRALKGPAKDIAMGFPAEREARIWPFLRQVAAFDPMPYWSVLEQPVFFAFGELDEQDNVPVQESVRRIEFGFRAAGKANYEIVVVPGVGHSLQTQPPSLSPLFVQRLESWLEKTLHYSLRNSASK